MSNCNYDPSPGHIHCEFHNNEEIIREITKNISMEEELLEEMLSDSGLEQEETNEVIKDILNNLERLYAELEFHIK